MFDRIEQDDSKHRARWRELYTEEECHQLKELVDAADKQVIAAKASFKGRFFVSGSNFLLRNFTRARHAVL